MAQVSVTVNGRPYEIACDDGQEERLLALGRYLDARVAELTAQVGAVGELRLTVMAALLIADELQDALSQLEELEEGQGAGANNVESAAAGALDDCARRLEAIAARLEGA
ncbi:MAG: cell division protein ZapA [Kiloniellales bacterium]